MPAALSSRPGEAFTMPPPEKMAVVEKKSHQVMKDRQGKLDGVP
ncbi:MAG TPA: hypothetical protein VIX14_17040 [Terriglobales bacterium]